MRFAVLDHHAALQHRDVMLLIDSYPFRVSGGQRQRVMITCAPGLEPLLLICDKRTTALDATTQAQILKLIRALQQRRGTAVLFITHDFGELSEITDPVVVMHGYTQKLIAAIPDNEAGRGSIALMLSADARLARSRAWVLRKNTSAENTTSSAQGKERRRVHQSRNDDGAAGSMRCSIARHSRPLGSGWPASRTLSPLSYCRAVFSQTSRDTGWIGKPVDWIAT